MPEEYLDARMNLRHEIDFRLTVGKEYVVYAVAIRNQQVWYYIHDDYGLWYPHRKPAPLFKVVDDRVSQHWRVKFTPGNLEHEVLLAFEEWVADERFYERLIDQEQAEWRIFRQRKQQMDEESVRSGSRKYPEQ